MRKINKKITSLVLRVQELVMQIDGMHLYYQTDISFLSVYAFDDNFKYTYKENVYLECDFYGEENAIDLLNKIIKDLEEKINE